jgi:hypothetical protein
MFARMQAELPILVNISTHAAYPDTAFLPEPTEDAAPAPAPAPVPQPPTQPQPQPQTQSQPLLKTPPQP